MYIAPASLDFGDRVVNTSSAPQIVTVTNGNPQPLQIQNVQSDNPEFAISSGCPTSLLPANHCDISVTFTPRAPGPRTATLRVTTDLPSVPLVVQLHGNSLAVPDHITLSPATATIAAGGSQLRTVQALDAFNSIGDVTTARCLASRPDGLGTAHARRLRRAHTPSPQHLAA